MRMPRPTVVLVSGLLWCGSAVVAAEGDLQSGPQEGAGLPGPFNPYNVTNADMPGLAGTRSDYTEQYGSDPVVLIFAREVSGPLVTLAKKLDAQVAKNKSARLRAVVVVLSEDEGTEAKLKELSRKEGIRNVSLALLEPAGPKRPRHYKLSPAADVTVVLYRKRRVAANHAFKKGELDEKAIGAVLRDVPRIVPRRQ
jgi:hypothetical protein